MKKLIISAVLLIAGATFASAQLVEIESVRRISLPEDVLVNVPTISPDGSFAIVSDIAGTALTKVDLSTGKTARIADNGSGMHLQISKDGNNVVFRQTTTGKNRLRHTALKSVNIPTGKITELVKPTRNLSGFRISESGAVSSVADGKFRSKGIAGAKNASVPVVGINRGHLELTVDGKTTTLDPQGRGSYLWPSISPDGKKIVYYKAQSGCYVCDLDGSNARNLGYIHAPVWLDNNTIVGCQDYDNGQVLTASKIVASSLDGVMQTLTQDSVIAINPSADMSGKKIVFSTDRGELYVINLR